MLIDYTYWPKAICEWASSSWLITHIDPKPFTNELRRVDWLQRGKDSISPRCVDVKKIHGRSVLLLPCRYNALLYTWIEEVTSRCSVHVYVSPLTHPSPSEFRCSMEGGSCRSAFSYGRVMTNPLIRLNCSNWSCRPIANQEIWNPTEIAHPHFTNTLRFVCSSPRPCDISSNTLHARLPNLYIIQWQHPMVRKLNADESIMVVLYILKKNVGDVEKERCEMRWDEITSYQKKFYEPCAHG